MQRATSNLWTPIAALTLAVLLSFLAGPSRRASAMRLPAQESGSGQCKTHIEIPEKPTWLPEGNPSGDELKKGNSFVAHVWWTGDGDPRKLTVTIKPSGLKGQCLNKGEKSFPDYTIEAGFNPLWDLADAVPDYAGDQAMTATTKQRYPKDTKVPIKITSYDWGGRVDITAQAQGCDPVPEDMPLDTDKDTLPDRWEENQWFWNDRNPQNQMLDKYDTSRKDSGGIGVDDADKDMDVGWTGEEGPAGAARVHDELGDGFCTFDEYRGLFVKGKHYRFDELKTDIGAKAGVKGPALKNLFIHDPDDHIFASRFIQLHRFDVHVINADEMRTLEPGKAGVVNPNSERTPQQHAVWIQEAALQGDENGRVFGFAQSFSINAEPKPIQMSKPNMKYDTDNMTPRGHNLKDFQAYVVAHELGHKLSLEHPSKPIAEGNDQSRAYTEANYWVTAGNAGVSFVHVWVVVQELVDRKAGRPQTTYLSIFRPFTAVSGLNGKDTTQIHGDNHDARVMDIAFSPKPAAGTLWQHKGELMDSYHEHAKLQDKMPAAELKKEKLRN